MASGSSSDLRHFTATTVGSSTVSADGTAGGVTFDVQLASRAPPSVAARGVLSPVVAFEPAFIETDFTVPLYERRPSRPSTAAAGGPASSQLGAAPLAHSGRQRSLSATSDLSAYPSGAMSRPVQLSPSAASIEAARAARLYGSGGGSNGMPGDRVGGLMSPGQSPVVVTPIAASAAARSSAVGPVPGWGSVLPPSTDRRFSDGIPPPPPYEVARAAPRYGGSATRPPLQHSPGVQQRSPRGFGLAAPVGPGCGFSLPGAAVVSRTPTQMVVLSPGSSHLKSPPPSVTSSSVGVAPAAMGAAVGHSRSYRAASLTGSGVYPQYRNIQPKPPIVSASLPPADRGGPGTVRRHSGQILVQSVIGGSGGAGGGGGSANAPSLVVQSSLPMLIPISGLPSSAFSEIGSRSSSYGAGWRDRGGGGPALSSAQQQQPQSTVLAVPRLPLAAHSASGRPAPLNFRGPSSSSSTMPFGAGSRPFDASPVAHQSCHALSLTVDDPVPLDCSRKSVRDCADGDMPGVLNLTTSNSVVKSAGLVEPPATSVSPSSHVSALNPAAYVDVLAESVSGSSGQFSADKLCSLNTHSDVSDIKSETSSHPTDSSPLELTVSTAPLCPAPPARDAVPSGCGGDSIVDNAMKDEQQSDSKSCWKEALCLASEAEKSFTPVPLAEEGEEREFVWDDYLEQTKCPAAPATSFKHVEYSLQSGFEKGMLVEVSNRDPPGTYWVASIVMPCGQLLRLRPVGCDDAAHDFWSDITSSEMHTIGWCREHDKNICPSHEVATKIENWQSVLQQSLEGAASPPPYMLDPQTGTLPIDQIKEGMYLEAQLDLDPDFVWPVKVIENVGGRLLLRYEAAESGSNDFWLFYLHHRLHPVGWARSHQCIYRPPDVVKHENKPEDYDWSVHLEKCLIEAENFQPPSEIFKDQAVIVDHHFKEGWKLEALHPSTPSVIRPATVRRIVNRQYFIVELDDCNPEPAVRNQLCCHAGSMNIFPVGWCVANGLTLAPIPGWDRDEFSWSEYMTHCAAEPAPSMIFAPAASDHEFEIGMKLEAVNPTQPGQICVATILRVVGNRLLKLCYDHQMTSGSIFYTVDSHDIFPIGWCESNQYQLKAPIMRVPVAAKTAAIRKVAVVQPDCHLPEDARSALYQQLKEANGSRSSSWCPKIYFNYRCFTGPYLSKGRLVLLPQSVGPGPVVLVMKEVLTMLINVAYKPSRVLRELQLDGQSNPYMHQQVLRAKYKGKSYSAKVEICRNGDQVEEFCRQVCVRLECCPNLISRHCVPAGSVCPDNCSHLSKTKFTNYFGKKRRKIGRPPGGHSNLEYGAKRPGRRKRHRKIILTLRKKHGLVSQAASEGISDENDGIGDYEVDSMSTSSGSTKVETLNGDVDAGNGLLVIAPRRKRHHDGLPAMEIKTRGAKHYRFEKRTHQKVLQVSTDKADGLQLCEVSPCQLFSNESILKLESNPLHWSVKEVVDFLKTTDCSAVARLFHDQEIDGQSLMLLSLPTIQEHLELKLGPAVKLCHQIERVKIAFFEQFA